MSVRKYESPEIDVPGYPKGTTTVHHKIVCDYCQKLRTAMNGASTDEDMVFKYLKRINKHGFWGDVIAQWNRNYGSVDSHSKFDRSDVADDDVTGRSRMKRGWSWQTLDEWLVQDFHDDWVSQINTFYSNWISRHTVLRGKGAEVGQKVAVGSTVAGLMGIGAALGYTPFGVMCLGLGVAMMMDPPGEPSDDSKHVFYLWNTCNVKFTDTIGPIGGSINDKVFTDRYGNRKSWPQGMPIGCPVGTSYVEFYNTNKNKGWLEKQPDRLNRSDYNDPPPEAPEGWTNAYQKLTPDMSWFQTYTSPWYNKFTGEELTGLDAKPWPYGTLRSDRIPHVSKENYYYSNFSAITDGIGHWRSDEYKQYETSWSRTAHREKGAFALPGFGGGAGRSTHIRAYEYALKIWELCGQLLKNTRDVDIRGHKSGPIDGRVFTLSLKKVIMDCWNDHLTNGYPGMPVHAQDAFYCFFGEIYRLHKNNRQHLISYNTDRDKRQRSWLGFFLSYEHITESQFDELYDLIIFGPQPPFELKPPPPPPPEELSYVVDEPTDDYNAEYAIDPIENTVPLDVGGLWYLVDSMFQDLGTIKSPFNSPDRYSSLEPTENIIKFNSELSKANLSGDPLAIKANTTINSAVGNNIQSVLRTTPKNFSNLIDNLISGITNKYGDDSPITGLAIHLKNIGLKYPEFQGLIISCLDSLMKGNLDALRKLCSQIITQLEQMTPKPIAIIAELTLKCTQALNEIARLEDIERQKQLNAVARTSLAENEDLKSDNLNINPSNC